MQLFGLVSERAERAVQEYPGVSVGASLGDIGTPGAPGESAPAGREQRVVVR